MVIFFDKMFKYIGIAKEIAGAKNRYDVKAKNPNLKEGHWVPFINMKNKKGVSQKLVPNT